MTSIKTIKSLKNSLMILPAVVGVTLLASVSAVQAEDSISLSANTAIVSDYRFRGIAMSGKDVAMQGGLDLTSTTGFYIGTWGSSIDTYEGSETELDIYAGYAKEFGDYTVDVGMLAYTYPGSSDTTYWEAYSSVAGALGDFGWTLGAAYAFDQSSIGGNDNIYLYVDGEYGIPDSPLSLTAHFAVEDGAFGKGSEVKKDWNLGVAYSVSDTVSVGVQYVDTNIADLGKGGVVFTLGASF